MAARKGRIEKETLEPLIEEGLGTREIGQRLGRGPTSIRYWLEIYGLVTKPKYHTYCIVPKRCGHCGETDPAKFYGNKRKVCGDCHNRYTLRIGQEKKRRAREYLGGACMHCGFNKYQASLDIHHVDPSIKDSRFAQMRGWSWERIERELQGCVLLCRNCHGAYHAGELQIDFAGA